MAFLEVITRTYKRPNMLVINKISLAAQTHPDWHQSILVDEIGEGIGAAQARLADYADKLSGRYIWILDDDDFCIRPTFVAELLRVATIHDPDVIVVKMDHGPRGILPDDRHWGHCPLPLGQIGCSGYVVRREIWQAHAAAWRSARYASDHDFISSVFTREHLTVYWHDVIASRVQQIGLGKPETV